MLVVGKFLLKVFGLVVAYGLYLVIFEKDESEEITYRKKRRNKF